MNIPTGPDEVLLRAIAQDPKRLSELAGIEPSWVVDEVARLGIEAAFVYHRRAGEQGVLRYATRTAIEREARDLIHARKQDDKRSDELRRGLASVLDSAAAEARIDEHTFREAIDQVREAAMDEIAREGLIRIVDGFRRGGRRATGVAAELRELSGRIQEGEPRGSLVGRLGDEATLVIRDYVRAKKTPGAGYIATPFPRLNELTGGGGRAGRLWLMAAYAKCGKAAPLDTKVMTPTGWREMGQIRVGDLVVNPEGGSARVVGVYPQGRKPVFRVTMSDGTSTRCCDEHLWKVNSAQRIARGLRPRVMPLKEIAKFGNRYFIPVVSRADLWSPGGRRNRPLDPYLLGALLGDGTFASKNNIAFSTADPEMVVSLRSLLPDGVEMIHRSRYDYGFRKTGCGHGGGANPLMVAVRRLGLDRRKSVNKFVPRAYLWAPVEVRLSVLQGLMDTDGSVIPSGAAEFSTVSPYLAEAVCFIARSMGCVVRCGSRVTRYSYRGRKLRGQRSFRVRISPPAGLELFRLPRKASRCGLDSRTPRRGIAKIERIGTVEQQCIALDSKNQLYVTDDLIVTHNTQFAKELVHRAGLSKLGALVVTGEQTKGDVRTMIVARHSHAFIPGGLDMRRLATGKLSRPEERALQATVADIAAGGLGPISYFQAPSGTTIGGDIRALVEATARKHPVDVLMLDHSLLFHPERRQDSEVGRVSEVIREAKQLSLDANGGRGLWVILCHQISRKGKEEADKRGGFHLPRDLAETAEAERSADLVLWAWRDEALIDVAEVRMGIAVDRYGPGDVRGWNAYERFTHAAVLPIEEEPKP